jgi:hypothetical protein
MPITPVSVLGSGSTLPLYFLHAVLPNMSQNFISPLNAQIPQHGEGDNKEWCICYRQINSAVQRPFPQKHSITMNMYFTKFGKTNDNLPLTKVPNEQAPLADQIRTMNELFQQTRCLLEIK